MVTGLVTTDDGSTYVTVNDTKNHTWRFLSIAAPDKQWTVETLPDQLERADLYGGEGRRLAFHPPDHLTLLFADVVAVAKSQTGSGSVVRQVRRTRETFRRKRSPLLLEMALKK